MSTRKIAQAISITGALASAAFASYKLVQRMKATKQATLANKRYDDALADTMDCSDPVAAY